MSQINMAVEPLVEEKPKHRSKFRKYRNLFILFLILSLSGFVYYKYFFTYSDGIQGGKMQKISKKGNIFKTWEGYLLISSSADNNNMSIGIKEWPFTVTNDSLAQLLEKYAERRVKLRYHQKNGTLPWRGDSKYIIYDVILDQ